MGGFFPIDEVIHLLPFRIRTLRKWARRGPFASCFNRTHVGPCGNSVLFINVSQLSSRFEELAALSYLEDSRKDSPADPAMNELQGLEEFAALVLDIPRL
jgi:hypothetical protein